MSVCLLPEQIYSYEVALIRIIMIRKLEMEMLSRFYGHGTLVSM